MFRLIVILIIAAVGIPLLVEQTMSPCDALERRLVNMAARDTNDPVLTGLLGGLAQQLTGGGLATAVVKQKYPNLPSPVACYIVYYEAYYHSIVKG